MSETISLLFYTRAKWLPTRAGEKINMGINTDRASVLWGVAGVTFCLDPILLN